MCGVPNFVVFSLKVFACIMTRRMRHGACRFRFIWRSPSDTEKEKTPQPGRFAFCKLGNSDHDQMMPSEGNLSHGWVFQVSQRLHFQLGNEGISWPEAGAMCCRHAPQTKHLRITAPLQYLPKILPDGSNAVMGEEKFRPLQTVFVNKADEFKAWPGQKPYTLLPRTEGECGDPLIMFFHTEEDRLVQSVLFVKGVSQGNVAHK